MPKASEQSKRANPEDIWGLDGVQSVFRQYLETERDRTALFRLAIVNYELGSLQRMLVYRHVAPKSSRCGSKEDMRVDIGDALANLIMLSEILGISSAEALMEACHRLENKEWRRH